MENFKRNLLATAIFAATLSACGGGGGGGISGSGSDAPADPPPVVDDGGDDGGAATPAATAVGTITSFGSIFVNGIEFETDEADIFVDGQPATEDDLDVGMVVTVRGIINDDGSTGAASVVIFDDEIEGPISAIATDGNGDSKQLTILGVDVIVERTGTVYEGVEFETLAVGDVVEVSGFPETGNNLRATRLEKTSTFVDGETEIEISGVVSQLNETTFNLESLVVDYSAADLSDIEVGLFDGLRVEVFGTLSGNTVSALEIDAEDDLEDSIEVDEEVEIEGPVSGFVDLGNFQVNGVSVDGSSAELSPSDLSIADGVILEVEGIWNGSVLTATSIEGRRGRIELESVIVSIDSASNTIELQNGDGTVIILVDVTTLLEDETDERRDFSLDDLAVGDFISVEALVDGDNLIATRIDREDTSEDEEAREIYIQGRVEAFTANLDITVLGATYVVTEAEFEGLEEDDISLERFFEVLQVGDLVNIVTSSNAPGTALEVEFEDLDRLDGGRDFDDDEEDDEDRDDESDDDFRDEDEDDESDEDESEDDSDEDESDEGDESEDDADEGESGEDGESEDDADEDESDEDGESEDDADEDESDEDGESEDDAGEEESDEGDESEEELEEDEADEGEESEEDVDESEENADDSEDNPDEAGDEEIVTGEITDGEESGSEDESEESSTGS